VAPHYISSRMQFLARVDAVFEEFTAVLPHIQKQSKPS